MNPLLQSWRNLCRVRSYHLYRQASTMQSSGQVIWHSEQISLHTTKVHHCYTTDHMPTRQTRTIILVVIMHMFSNLQMHCPLCK